MNCKQIPLGPLQTNCYVLYNSEKKAIIIDPGGDYDVLENWLHSHNLKPEAILLTHAHFDHIGAVDQVRHSYTIDVYLHEKEKAWLSDPEKNGSSRFLGGPAVTTGDADYLISGESDLTIGSFTFQLLETPGHSPGSVSFYHKDSKIVFSGDTLFYGGIGRTDLPGGDHGTLLHAIHNKLLELPEDTTVACGHGPTTTIENEMNNNPFLNGF